MNTSRRQHAAKLRPFVAFLDRFEEREIALRWLDYLSSNDDSGNGIETKTKALRFLEEMLRTGKLGPPFQRDPPATVSNRLVALADEASVALMLGPVLKQPEDDVESLLNGSNVKVPPRLREAQFHSQLLNMQSEQQSELEEVLWEKNRELEKLRKDFQRQLQAVASKRLEKEIELSDLEQSRERVVREAEVAMETLRGDLKQKADAHHAAQMERLVAMVEGHREERLKCQEEHQEALQTMELDVKARVERVKNEYCQRLLSHGEQISQLQNDLQKCETCLRKRQKETRCLEEEREYMERRERQAGKELTGIRAKLKLLHDREQLEHEKSSEETSTAVADFRQLMESERSELGSVTRTWSDIKDRLAADLVATKERLAGIEDANAAVMREAAESHRRTADEIRQSFDIRLSDSTRRHEAAVGILRDKLTNRVDETQIAAAELARTEMEVENVRRRAQEEIGHVQARCTVESARQLENVKRQLETLKQELSTGDRARDRAKTELETALREERSRFDLELDELRISVEKERANLRVQIAREMEEERLRHETAMEEVAGPLTASLTSAADLGNSAAASRLQRITVLSEEESKYRRSLEEAKKERREALMAIGKDRREDVDIQRRRMMDEIKEARQRSEKEQMEAQVRNAEEKAQLEIQFNKSVEELALRHTGRMEEALSITSRLDDCVKGLVSVNSLISDRLRDVAVASSRNLDQLCGVK